MSSLVEIETSVSGEEDENGKSLQRDRGRTEDRRRITDNQKSPSELSTQVS